MEDSGRVGFFGGTFDPPHRGHAAIARAATEQFELSRVLWAPVGRQPLKGEGDGASYVDRLAMVTLACEEDSRFEACDADAPRPNGEANYTVETLERLLGSPGGAELFCIAGADSFHDLRRWREPERLLELAEWIVISRPGFALEAPQGMKLTAAQRGRVHLLDAVHEDVSATELRRRLHAGEACGDLLAAPVEAYIAALGLYRVCRGGVG